MMLCLSGSPLLIAGVVSGLCGLAQSPSTKTALWPAEREVHWLQDLQFLAAGLGASGHTVDLQRGISTRGQIDFSDLYPKSLFDATLEALSSGIPNLSDGEIVLQLMRLMASANVAHNLVQTRHGMGLFSRLALTFHWYPDCLAVTEAEPQYSAALGARVLTIGGMKPEQLLLDLAPYISHENDVWLRQLAPDFIMRVVLQHFKMIGSDGRVILNLDRPGEAPFTLSVSFSDPQVKKIPFTEALHVRTPFFRSHPGEYYWYQYLPDSQTLYIQYNVCQNNPKQRFGDFARQALAEADAHALKRVVIDLRQNGGGDSRVINPLKSGLASRLQSIGHVYVLTGPATFSSAVENAIELRSDLSATLVGEPSGGMPGGYGEVKYLTLPNSKLVVQYTSKRDGPKGAAGPSTLEPDVAVSRTLADALAGRDPALDAAIGGTR